MDKTEIMREKGEDAARLTTIDCVQTRRPTLASGTSNNSVAVFGDLLAGGATVASIADPSPSGIAAAGGADAEVAKEEEPLNLRHIRFQ